MNSLGFWNASFLFEQSSTSLSVWVFPPLAFAFVVVSRLSGQVHALKLGLLGSKVSWLAPR